MKPSTEPTFSPRGKAAALAAGIALTFAAPAVADEKDWSKASDIGRGALVIAAIGLPAASGDGPGAFQAVGSVGSAFALTAALKETFPETRPDGSDRRSFPSSHASTSFAAAATLQNRHGWEVGIPAQLVAGLVGLARVEADKHYWHDVIVGAAIGEAAGFLITTRSDSNVRVLRWGDTKGGGVIVAARF